MDITRRQFMQTVSAAASSILLQSAVFPYEKRNVRTDELKTLSVLRVYDDWDCIRGDSTWARVVGIGTSGVAAINQLQTSLSDKLMSGMFSCGVEDVDCYKSTAWLVLLTDDREGTLAQAEEIISCHENNPDILITNICLAGKESMPEGINSLGKLPGTTILIPKETNSKSDRGDKLLFMRTESLLKLYFAQTVIGVDLADVKTVLNATRVAVAGADEASGPNRAVVAAEKAVADLQHKGLNLRQSPSALIHICGNNYSLNEAVDSTTHLCSHFDVDAPIVYSMGFDESAESYMVTIFAGVG